MFLWPLALKQQGSVYVGYLKLKSIFPLGQKKTLYTSLFTRLAHRWLLTCKKHYLMQWKIYSEVLWRWQPKLGIPWILRSGGNSPSWGSRSRTAGLVEIKGPGDQGAIYFLKKPFIPVISFSIIMFNSVKWYNLVKVILQFIFISNGPLAGSWLCLGSKPVCS